MRAFWLLAAVARLAAAIPTTLGPAADAAIDALAVRDVAAAHQARAEAGDPWTTYICSQNHFKENCVRVYALNNCANIPDAVHAKNKSMMQWKGWICVYYFQDNCYPGDYVTLTVDSRNEFVWMETMGTAEWSILSTKCICPSTHPETEAFLSSDNATGSSILSGPSSNLGSILACSEPNFQGNCTVVNALERCSANFAYGTVKSIIQQQGTVCQYFRQVDCERGNHSPSKAVDSGNGTVLWGDMGDWTGTVHSFKCSIDQRGVDPLTRSVDLTQPGPQAQPLDFADPLDKEDTPQPGRIVVYRLRHLRDHGMPYNAWMRCAPGPGRSVESLEQQKGAYCAYYQDTRCKELIGYMDSRDLAVLWEVMGKWEGKVYSMQCWPNDPGREATADELTQRSTDTAPRMLSDAGHIIVSSVPHLTGLIKSVDAWLKCANAPIAIASLKQYKGAYCKYYAKLNCDARGSVFGGINSLQYEMIWDDLGFYAGQVRSIRCWDQPVKGGSVEVPQPGPDMLTVPRPIESPSNEIQLSSFTRSSDDVKADSDKPGWVSFYSEPLGKGTLLGRFDFMNKCRAWDGAVKIGSFLQFGEAICWYSQDVCSTTRNVAPVDLCHGYGNVWVILDVRAKIRSIQCFPCPTKNVARSISVAEPAPPSVRTTSTLDKPGGVRLYAGRHFAGKFLGAADCMNFCGNWVGTPVGSVLQYSGAICHYSEETCHYGEKMVKPIDLCRKDYRGWVGVDVDLGKVASVQCFPCPANQASQSISSTNLITDTLLPSVIMDFSEPDKAPSSNIEDIVSVTEQKDKTIEFSEMLEGLNPVPVNTTEPFGTESRDGTVVLCTQENLQGQCWRFNAYMLCLARFPKGMIRSVAQEAGQVVCYYYREPNCPEGGRRAIVNSKGGRKIWAHMDEWSGAVSSLVCLISI